MPAGQTLVRDGVGGARRLVVAIDDAAADLPRARGCGARPAPTGIEAARGPAGRGVRLPAGVTAMLAPDDRTLAVYDFSDGKAVVFDLLRARLRARRHGVDHLAGGLRVSRRQARTSRFSGDGRMLLLGSLNRGCRRTPTASRVCGIGRAVRAPPGPAGWRSVATLLPTPERRRADPVRPVGGVDPRGRAWRWSAAPASPGLSGALWVYALGGSEPAAGPDPERRPSRRADSPTTCRWPPTAAGSRSAASSRSSCSSGSATVSSTAQVP